MGSPSPFYDCACQLTTTNILFVCEGNTCRSPMAEALLKQAFASSGLTQFSVSSCGLDVHRERFDAKLPTILGYAFNSISDKHPIQINADLVGRADLILAMEDSQVDEISANYPQASRKIASVRGYIDKTGDVEDYASAAQSDFLSWLRSSKERLAECIPGIIEKLRDELLRP